MTPSRSTMDEFTIRDVETLKVLADPLRMQLLERLRVRATVKELAAVLGGAPSRLYYHLNLLEEHGLVRVVDLRLDEGGAVEKVYLRRARRFRVVNPLLVADGLSGDETDALLGSVVDGTRRKLAEALRAGLRDERTPPRYPFVTAKPLRLTETQLTVFYQRLTTLMEQVETLARLNQGGDAPLYELALIFTRDPGGPPPDEALDPDSDVRSNP